MKFPLLIRAGAIAAVAVAILFPVALVTDKVAERRGRAGEVESSFARETSGPQTVVGPLLALACEETVVEERVVKRSGKDDTVAEQKTRACPTAYFPPRTLDVAARVPVESRHRGIYPIRLYRAALDFAGEFDWPSPPSQEGAVSRRWKGASIVVATGDARGIKGVSPLAWGADTIVFAAGRNDREPGFSLEAPLGDFGAIAASGPASYRFSMELVGTGHLMLGPVGDTTKIRLSSDWPHPSFMGAFSPDERTVGALGFEAAWKTTHFATGGRSAWQPRFQEGQPMRWEKATGFSLADPVNVYTLSYRATEYGFLFVLFTFAGLALAEVTTGIRLHPVQYALVGSGLAVFFLLLIALAEHIAFGKAYAVAAAACMSLLTYYLRHPLGSLARTATFLGALLVLYGALYALLRSEDHALLAGSLLVFGVLAAGMVATRRMDWGSIAARLEASPSSGSAA
jgi:inner membrane protein